MPAPSGELQVVASPPRRGGRIRLSLILPTYNEGRNIAQIVGSLTEVLEGPLGGAYEIIVVDDDSPDRTWEIASALTPRYPRLRVVRRRGERGLSTAVIRGWQVAQGQVLGVLDADLQHPPEATLRLWREVERGADLAVGSRHVQGGGMGDWPLHRRLLSRGARLLGLLLLPGVIARVSDPMSGYFMVHRSAIAGKVMSPVGYKILLEVIGRGDIDQVSEVGYVFRERLEGESKVTWKQYVEYLLHLLRLRAATLPAARLARFAAVGLGGVAVDMLFLYLLSDPAMLGWGLTRSKLVAAGIAIVHNFLWNDAWTFRRAAGDRQSARPKLERLFWFALVCGAGLSLNVVLLNLQFNWLGVNRYLANVIAIGVVTLWNFSMISRIYARFGQLTRLPRSGTPPRARSRSGAEPRRLPPACYGAEG